MRRKIYFEIALRKIYCFKQVKITKNETPFSVCVISSEMKQHQITKWIRIYIRANASMMNRFLKLSIILLLEIFYYVQLFSSTFINFQISMSGLVILNNILLKTLLSGWKMMSKCKTVDFNLSMDKTEFFGVEFHRTIGTKIVFFSL